MSISLQNLASHMKFMTTSAGLAPGLLVAALFWVVWGFLYASLSRSAKKKGLADAAFYHGKTSTNSFITAGILLLGACLVFVLGLLGVF
ncbi:MULTISPECIES: hypothetical protein [Gammaproteobacteria]|uniref:hypothetical protein n=1 Tax=Gammaproteobacteria TaxID=1236 RepID=UPI000E32A70F|nr:MULTISPECIES: hypothetical protein [Gammaproteobacteria]